MPKRLANRDMINALLDAIVRNDVAEAKKFFHANANLVTVQILQDRLFRGGIFHWLNMQGDTALYLAAAGYRTEVLDAIPSRSAKLGARRQRSRRVKSGAARNHRDVP